MRIKCFIFSWKGQFENAEKLENELSKLIDVVVINSDETNTKSNWITLDDSCYFSEQFRTALNEFDCNEYDMFFHVQADASYDNWSEIIEAMKVNYDKYKFGVYAPNVNYTFYDSSKVDLEILETNIVRIANTDNTCWFIHKDIIEKVKENLYLLDGNHYGWGFDLLACSLSMLCNRYVLRDYNYTINHPPSSNYDHSEPEREMAEFFNKCPENIKHLIYGIKSDINYLKRLLNIEVNSEIFIYDTGR